MPSERQPEAGPPRRAHLVRKVIFPSALRELVVPALEELLGEVGPRTRERWWDVAHRDGLRRRSIRPRRTHHGGRTSSATWSSFARSTYSS